MDEHDEHDDDAGRVIALRATAHPTRLRILSLLTGTPMSAAEVARELGLTHANASYHLRVLLEADELVEAGEERIRGGVAKRYRYPHERTGGVPHHHSEMSTPEDQVAYARSLGHEMARRARHRTIGVPGPSSDLEGWVDRDTWTHALEHLREASRLLHEANRAPRTAGTIHVSATSWAFEMNDDQAQR